MITAPSLPPAPSQPPATSLPPAPRLPAAQKGQKKNRKSILIKNDMVRKICGNVFNS